MPIPKNVWGVLKKSAGFFAAASGAVPAEI
jgi:hypothetical protein